ncbi:MAG: hypothetical protein ACOJUL_14855 [Candidatus Pollutiaquabacter aromativorans]
MMNRLYALLLAMLPLLAIGQSYNGPESAEFDYVNRRWLIGNTSSHQILSRDSLGNLSVLVNSTTSGPYGIEIVGDTVFCCSGGSIKGYLLSDGTPVYNLNVGGSFLNGLTHDNAGNLFATDFSTKSIIRVHIASQTFAPVATSLPNTPNGIVFDGYNNRCVFVNWGSNAPIRAIDLATYAVTTVVTTTLGSCDGITRDAIGRYYVSNWSGQSIVRFDSAFAAPPATVVSGLSNPADIFYNVVDDTLAIPNAGNNTVTFFGFPIGGRNQQCDAGTSGSHGSESPACRRHPGRPLSFACFPRRAAQLKRSPDRDAGLRTARSGNGSDIAHADGTFGRYVLPQLHHRCRCDPEEVQHDRSLTGSMSGCRRLHLQPLRLQDTGCTQCMPGQVDEAKQG